jgi:hypothetical protein
MGSVRILLVVPIERTPVLKRRIFCCCLDLVVEDDVGEADDRVADELGNHRVVSYPSQDDRWKWLDSQKCDKTNAPRHGHCSQWYTSIRGSLKTSPRVLEPQRPRFRYACERVENATGVVQRVYAGSRCGENEKAVEDRRPYANVIADRSEDEDAVLERCMYEVSVCLACSSYIQHLPDQRGYC